MDPYDNRLTCMTRLRYANILAEKVSCIPALHTANPEVMHLFESMLVYSEDLRDVNTNPTYLEHLLVERSDRPDLNYLRSLVCWVVRAIDIPTSFCRSAGWSIQVESKIRQRYWWELDIIAEDAALVVSDTTLAHELPPNFAFVVVEQCLSTSSYIPSVANELYYSSKLDLGPKTALEAVHQEAAQLLIRCLLTRIGAKQ